MINEFRFIKNIQERVRQQDQSVTGIGDDCAVLSHGRLWCTDVMTEGSHFILEKADLGDLAYKSMMINISDIAAMGGYPEYALLTLGLTPQLGQRETDALIEGYRAACEEYGIDILGGDTVAAGHVFLSVSLLGSVFRHPVLRSGARSGDFIYVSGTLGDSGLGLSLVLEDCPYDLSNPEYFLERHYSPTPRVELMRYLADNARLHACIDISDGLGDDLIKLAQASGKGFFLEWDQLPLAVDEIGAVFGRDKEYFYRKALNGGEDFELILCTPEILDVQRIHDATGVRVTPIGRIRDEGYEICYHNVSQDPAAVIKKYQHFDQE